MAVQSFFGYLRGYVLLTLMLYRGSAVAEYDEPKQLYFMFMASRHPLFKTSGAVAGVDMALEAIHKQNRLPGYRLNYTTLLDSQVNS